MDEKRDLELTSTGASRSISLCEALPCFIVTGAGVGGLIAWVAGVSIFAGVGVGLAVGISPILLLGLLVALLQFWRPDWPRCLCGARNYEHVSSTKLNDTGSNHWVFLYRCVGCGRNFIQSGNRFDVRNDDGLCCPYMTHSEWGRWRPVRVQSLESPAVRNPDRVNE